MNAAHRNRAFASARAAYGELGVDVDQVLKRLAKLKLSLHCWQADDVGGFERSGGLADGGIMATGNYPGRARTPDELRQDLEAALRLIPGRHKLALHAIYGEFGGRRVERDAVGPEHFANWIAWAKRHRLGLDFNPTFFSHPKAASGFTLSHADPAIRSYWIEHGRACRRIGAAFGRQLGIPCVTNFWIPDGYKDLPADRLAPRVRLENSLDRIFRTRVNPRHNIDTVESKLFGIGSESYVTGSHEFYLGYAVRHRLGLCLDTGHFHPTETVADKLSAVLLFVPSVLLHVSRGVRWDSDHVVILSDDLVAIAQELVRHDFLDRVHLGLDYFDASINRLAAYAIGARSLLKALLYALLEPSATLRGYEQAGDHTRRLALLEELKTLPFGAVWDAYCQQQDVPVGRAWLADVQRYERTVLSARA